MIILSRKLCVLFLMTGLIMFTACKKDSTISDANNPDPVNPDSTLAVLTTTAIQSINENSAVSGGNITSDGGHAITSRGICISTHSNPTISDMKVTSGSGTGSFSCTASNLTANTHYYLRAFATSNVGTAYGNELSFYTYTTPDPAKLIFIGGDDSVYCFDASNGHLKWRRGVNQKIKTIAYSQGRIYVANNDFPVPASNKITCYDTTGLFKWSIPVSGNTFSSHIVAVDNVIYAGTFDGTFDGFYAFNATTGAAMWQYTSTSTTTNFNIDKIVVANNSVLLPTNDGNSNLKAVNAQTGMQNWISTGTFSQFEPIVVNNKIFYHSSLSSSSTYIGVADMATGNTFPDVFSAVPAPLTNLCFGNGMLIYGAQVSTPTLIPGLVALDASTGQIIWQVSNTALETSSLNPYPQVQNNYLVYMNYAWSILIYDITAGTFVRQLSFGGTGRLLGGMTFVDGIIYMGFENDGSISPSYEGRLVAYEVNTNSYKWVSEKLTDLTTPACVVSANDKMYSLNNSY